MEKEIIQFQNLSTASENGSRLEQLNFQVCESDIVGILFDSILDKNSFIECLKGESSIVSGNVFIREKMIGHSDFNRKANRNIEVIGTDACLIPTLDLVDNLFLKDYRAYISNQGKKEKYQKITERFNICIPMNKEVDRLSFIEIILFRMIKAYIDEKQVIVLSDITGNLNHTDLEKIYTFIKKLRSSHFSFIIIESIDETMLHWTNHVYFIKKGKTIGILNNPSDDLLYFHSFDYQDRRSKNSIPEELMIEDSDLYTNSVLSMHKVCNRSIHDLSFTLNKGDPITLFFNDQKSLFDFTSIFSDLRMESGHVHIEGKSITMFRKNNLLKHGVAFINSSLGHSELLFNMSVIDNLGIILSNKMKGVWGGNKYIKSIDHFIEQYIGTGISSRKLRDLSPEYIIRLSYIRWLLYRPKLVFIQNPLLEIDLNLQRIVIDMIHFLHINKITVVLLLSNLSSINEFNYRTIYVNGDVR